MATGDNVAIAREISGQLGMGRNIRPARELVGKDDDPSRLTTAQADQIGKTDGFAEVFPEHKYAIVKALQDRDRYSCHDRRRRQRCAGPEAGGRGDCGLGRNRCGQGGCGPHPDGAGGFR